MDRDYFATIVEVVGVVQALFLSVALWYVPGNHQRANRWLVLLCPLFAVHFSYAVINQNDLLFVAPSLTLLRLPLNFLYGPLIYLYLWQVTQPWEELKKWQLLRHFAVFSGMLLLYLPSLQMNHNQLLHLLYYGDLVRVWRDIPPLNNIQQWYWVVSNRWVTPIFAIHVFTYLALNLRLLRHHKRRVTQHFSAMDKVSLNWLRNLLLSLCAIAAIEIVNSLLFDGTYTGRVIQASLQPLLVLFLSALGIFGLLQKSIPLPSPVQAPIEPAPEESSAATKYQSSSLTEEAQIEGLAKLHAYMQSAKPYLDSDLTVVGLAAGVCLPARHVSQIINSGLGQNFLDFINFCRVDEAKRMLADPAWQGSILDVAMAVGFNSKSAFYGAFKRHTGQTPSAFRAQASAGANVATALNGS